MKKSKGWGWTGYTGRWLPGCDWGSGRQKRWVREIAREKCNVFFFLRQRKLWYKYLLLAGLERDCESTVWKKLHIDHKTFFFVFQKALICVIIKLVNINFGRFTNAQIWCGVVEVKYIYKICSVQINQIKSSSWVVVWGTLWGILLHCEVI